MPTPKAVPHGTTTEAAAQDERGDGLSPTALTEVQEAIRDALVAESYPAALTPAQEAILARWVMYVLPDGPHTGEHRPALVITKSSDDRCTLSVFTDPTDAPYQGHPYQLGVTSKFQVAYDETGETLNTWH